MGVLFVALLLSMLTASTAIYVTSSYSRAWSDAKSETALQLAEAGVNEELRYIDARMQQYNPPFAHGPSVKSGQPFPGNPGRLNGVAGEYWVYSTVPGTQKPWNGQGPVQITCKALVWAEDADTNGGDIPPGARTVQRSVVVKAAPKSLFGMFTLFGLDAANHNNQPSVAVTGSGRISVEGKVGTNGIVQNGAGVMTYDAAFNYNVGYSFPSGSRQFSDGDVSGFQEPFVVPTVTEVLCATFPQAGPPVGTTPWLWLYQHNDNDQIRQYSKSTPALTNAGTSSAGFSKQQVTLDNTWWNGKNTKPGTNVRTLILPPGDYFFSDINLLNDSGIEFLIDNAGLTTPQGSNPSRRPVRIWVNGYGTQDRLEEPIALTNPNDASTFRIYYGKDGATLKFFRDKNSDEGDYTTAGCIYAVTARLDPVTGLPAISGLMGTQVNLHGDTPTHGDLSTLIGAVYADRIQVIGKWRIIRPGLPIGNGTDPAGGMAYDPDCDDMPCYDDQ